MEIVIRRTNNLSFRIRVTETPNLAERLRLLKLLAEEEAKSQPLPKEKIVAGRKIQPHMELS
jgi:hypothetical protein